MVKKLHGAVLVGNQGFEVRGELCFKLHCAVVFVHC